MKKVVYSIKRTSYKEHNKVTGIGYITDTDLIIACNGKNQKAYVRVFEDCIKDCNAIIGKQDEFKGNYSEIREIEVETKHGNFDVKEVELEYSIWFKLVK